MIRNIRGVFEELLNESDWMDIDTKATALRKVQTLEF